MAARLILLVLSFALGALLVAPKHDKSPYLRDDIRMPVPDGHYSLAVTILRPRGDGPFGALVLNHGVGAFERFLESPALLIQASRSWVSAAAGGWRARRVCAAAAFDNGHFLFGDAKGIPLWLPAVERFLERHAIPFTPKRAA